MICIGDHCCYLSIAAEPVFAILAAFSNCMLCKHQNNTHHSLSTWGPRLSDERLFIVLCIGIADHCCCLAIVAEPVFAILAAFSNCMLCKHQNNTHHCLSTWGPRLCNESLLHASFACSKANPFTALASHFASSQSHFPLTLIGKGRVYGI